MSCWSMFYRVSAAVIVLAQVGITRAGQIDFPNFTSTVGLSMQGSAGITGNLLRLNPASSAQAGSVWFSTQQSVADGFSTTFQFKILGLGGINDDDGNTGADGLAFVIQNESVTSLGSNAAGIGYDDITNSLAVEFDTFRNSIRGDGNGNHISVQTIGTAANSSWHSASLGCALNLPYMSDGNIHTASIHYQPGTMSISLDGTSVLTVPLDLESKLDLNDGKAWVGFTAATFAAYESHDVLSWSMAPVPEPSAFVLFGIGFIGFSAYLWRRHVKRHDTGEC